MKIKVSAGIIGAVLMLSASQSWAVTLKLSHNQDKSHPVHKAMEFFAKKSKEYSNGDITIRIYPNGTLGVLIHLKYEKKREDIGLFGIWRD